MLEFDEESEDVQFKKIVMRTERPVDPLERLELPLLVVALRMSQEEKRLNEMNLNLVNEYLFADTDIKRTVGVSTFHKELVGTTKDELRAQLERFDKITDKAVAELLSRIEALTMGTEGSEGK